MKHARQLAGIARTCCLLPAIFCLAQSPTDMNPAIPPAGPARTQGFAGMRSGQASPEAARKKAEELAQEARVLTQKQTSVDARAAIVLFRESARQFQMGALPERA